MYVKWGINKYHIGKVHKIDTYSVRWREKKHSEGDREKKFNFFACTNADVWIEEFQKCGVDGKMDEMRKNEINAPLRLWNLMHETRLECGTFN